MFHAVILDIFETTTLIFLDNFCHFLIFSSRMASVVDDSSLRPLFLEDKSVTALSVVVSGIRRWSPFNLSFFLISSNQYMHFLGFFLSFICINYSS